MVHSYLPKLCIPIYQLWCIAIYRLHIENNKQRKSLVENIKFKGKIIKSAVIYRYSKKYVVYCIQLEYTNTNEIYIFNDFCALKIKNGIATIPGGLFDADLIAKYAEINMGNSVKNKIYFQNGKVDEFEIGLGSGGLLENDMNSCN